MHSGIWLIVGYFDNGVGNAYSINQVLLDGSYLFCLCGESLRTREVQFQSFGQRHSTLVGDDHFLCPPCLPPGLLEHRIYFVGELMHFVIADKGIDKNAITLPLGKNGDHLLTLLAS